MKIQLFLGIILSTFCFMGCEQESQVMNKAEADLSGTVIKYGTAFGMCLGPCKKELVFENDVVTYTIYYNGGREVNGADPVSVKEQLGSGYIDVLSKSVDFETFVKMQEKIGCPDCADGGSEWVEITKNDSRHKVTFEYGADIKEIAPLLKLLREKRVYFEEKYTK